MKKNLLCKTLFSWILIGAAGRAHASAFQLAEISTSGLGRAYSGEAAIADNASVVATNPALMAQFDKTEFSVGGVYVDSSIKLSGKTKVLKRSGYPARDAGNDNVIPGALVPNFYIVHPINDRFAIGGGMNVNFGLKSEYDGTYAAGIFGGKTDLTALNFNLSGSYKISKGWSAGIGLNAVYAQAEIERTAGILSPALPIKPSDVMVHLKGNAWGFGWNAGLVYEINERNRFGLAYHSYIDLDFKDNNAFSYQPKTRGFPYAYYDVGRLTLNLPAYWEFSGYHQMTDKFAMHYSIKYTEWSRFKELHGTYDSGLTAFRKTENYTDNTRIALGATYDVNEKLTLRAGIAFDEAAVGEYESASIPDTDRTWYSLGATYHFTPNLSVDFGYAHLIGSKTTFKERKTILEGLTIEADYTSRAHANLYGLNLNYRF